MATFANEEIPVPQNSPKTPRTQSELSVLKPLEHQIWADCRDQAPDWDRNLALWLEQQKPWLLRRCAAHLGNEDDAEDVVQVVMLRTLRGLHAFQGRSTLRTWLTCIADNQCNTLHRKRSRTAIDDHLRHCITLFEENRVDETSPEEQDLPERVARVLSTLSSNGSEILRLRFFEDLPLNDIARLLNLTLSASKMRLYRALGAFKQAYIIEEVEKLKGSV